MANKQQNTERPNPLLQVGLKPKTGAIPPQVRTVTREEEPSARAYPYPDEEQEPEEQPGGRGRELKSDEEKATEKVTAYFTPAQYDQIEDLRRAYRKRTGKRISVNALLRRLVENATLEDLLRTY